MIKEETTRQQKVGRLIQRDISDIFQKEAAGLVAGTLVTVTVVRMTPDLEMAKVYLSIFPFEKSTPTIEKIRQNAWQIRLALGKRVKNQLRVVPEVVFYVDDSMEYATKIESVLDTIK